MNRIIVEVDDETGKTDYQLFLDSIGNETVRNGLTDEILDELLNNDE